MDAQSTVGDNAPLIALIQSIARQELERAPTAYQPPSEALAENRFLASRDGMDANLIDLVSGDLAPASHACDDHGLLARHWMIGAAGRHTNTPPLPALPTLETSRRTSSPPWR